MAAGHAFVIWVALGGGLSEVRESSRKTCYDLHQRVCNWTSNLRTNTKPHVVVPGGVKNGVHIVFAFAARNDSDKKKPTIPWSRHMCACDQHR